MIHNQTRVTGLAARTGERARGAGWTVAGVGNWRGTVPSTTVYHPRGLREQALLLARDLQIERIRPMVAPMSTTRLTVVLA